MRFELSSVHIIELVAVAMTFRNGVGMIRNLGSGILGQITGLRSEPHGSTHVRHFALLIQEANDGCGRIFVEFCRVGSIESDDVASEFNCGALHPQTNTKERNVSFSCVADRLDFALDAAFAKTAGN